MAKRNRIKGIAYGIAHSFTSRNNDINGFWALGVYYKIVSRYQNRLTIDLLTGRSEPKQNHSTWKFQKFLFNQLAKNGLNNSNVTKALIIIDFDVQSEEKQQSKPYWGEPFICRVELIDDLGKIHKIITGGMCWQCSSYL